KTQRRANNVSLRSQGSSKRSPIDEKGLATSTSLFRQPCLASPRNKLQFNGKTGFSTGTRYKKAEEILSGTPDGGNHRPTHQTDLVTFKNTGRMLKWKFQLEALDITYRPRTSTRDQILADFIAERPDEEDPPMETPIEEVIPEPWTLFTDRSSCLEGSGAGLILTSPEGEEFTYALRFEFDESNNEAEYEALMAGLRIVEQMGVKNLKNKKSLPNVGRKNKSIEEQEILAVVEEEGYCWMTPLIEYLMKGTLPADTKKARAVRIKARQYAMINDVLYRKSFLEPWLRYVGLTQAEYVVKEIHEGSYNMHSSPRSIVAKAIRFVYYWPTMHKDARNIIRKYPFPEAQGNVKFLIVAIDYFTKWVEAKLVATITGNQFKKFVSDNILNIKKRFASVKHPQSNGQVERANRSLGEGIKARLGEDNRNWVEEVSHVLWEHCTMIKISNGDTPFSLTYGTKAVISVEIGMPSLRYGEVNRAENDEELLLNLDILKERREKAAVREAMPRWKSIITLESAAQPSAQETSSTAATKQAMLKTAES
ncbi:reverse transcriptase domain-containing protein, partial [Tanacetum coccineum]